MARAKTSKFRTSDGRSSQPAQCQMSLCFKILHNWVVSFVHQGDGRKKLKIFTDEFTFYRVWPGQSCFSKEQTGWRVLPKAFNCFWLSSSWILHTDGEPGHKTQLWHHTHSLARLANTSTRLALTGCLVWEVKVAGSVRGMAHGTVLLGRLGYSLGRSYMSRTLINMDKNRVLLKFR